MNTKSASDLRGSVGTGRSGDEGGIRQRERRVRFSGACIAAPHPRAALLGIQLLQVFLQGFFFGEAAVAMPTYHADLPGCACGVGESWEERARGSEA